MGILTLFAPSTSLGSVVELVIYIIVTAVTYWAVQRIITWAGFPNIWMVLPISTIVFTWICYIIFWSDVHAIYFGSGFDFGFSGISQVSVFWNLDEASIVLNWLFLLVIAFSQTPAVSERLARSSVTARLMPTATTAAASPTTSAASTASTPPPAAVPTTRARPASAAGPGAGPAAASSAPVAKKTGAQFCSWCGEATPGNRALFHDCGPKDRPATFCKNCGTALPAESAPCAACGAD